MVMRTYFECPWYGFVISDGQVIDCNASAPHANYTYSIYATVPAGIDRVSVESILLGYSVLMITNLNDEYTWVSWPKQVENRTYTLTMLEWLIAFEKRLRSCTRGWLQEPEQEDFSQAKNKALGWSTAQDEIGRQSLQDDFKPPKLCQESLYFIV